MNVVTISAAYGAAGSVVGPAVAERLGVPFFDRAIPTAVAEELGIAFDHAFARDEQVPSRIWRWIAAAVPPMSTDWLVGAPPPPRDAVLTDERLLACTQQAIRRCVADKGGVILGRAGAIVLRGHPKAVHVRLDGDAERRIRQAMTIQKITEPEARAALVSNDEARSAYVRHFYRTDAANPEHYHLVLDSTRIPLPKCVDLIVAAATAGTAHTPQKEPEAAAAPAVS